MASYNQGYSQGYNQQGQGQGQGQYGGGGRNSQAQGFNQGQQFQQQQIPPQQFQPPNYSGPCPLPFLLEENVINEKPTSPVLLYKTRDGTFAMPVQSCFVDLEFHVATAFGRLKVTFVNTSKVAASGLFVFPLTGTVTSVEAKVGKNWVQTSYISQDDANNLADAQQQEEKAAQDASEAQGALSSYMPGMFRLPINNIPVNTPVEIEVDFIETLTFGVAPSDTGVGINNRQLQAGYQFKFPLQFGEGVLPRAVPLDRVIGIRCLINCLCPGVSYQSQTHQFHPGQTKFPNRTCIIALPQQSSTDFHLSYSGQTNSILSTIMVETPKTGSTDGRGSFVCFVNPPPPNPSMVYKRDVVFLIDRSGSMDGAPIRQACQAVIAAVQSLTANDTFAICCFDHGRAYFGAPTVAHPPARAEERFDDPPNAFWNCSEQNKQLATKWLQGVGAMGTTDINSPLMWAIQACNSSASQRGSIPFVILLTDGCVEGENQMVHQCTAPQTLGHVRLLTFGIGKYCNWYFLKMLALKGKGWMSGTLYEEEIHQKAADLILQASTPVLTDVSINIDTRQMSNIVFCPEICPDLFCGRPIMMSGKYSGQFPQTISIEGKQCTGQPYRQEIQVDMSEVVPVGRVFLSQHMDMLTANEWLSQGTSQNVAIKQELIETSTRNNMPSPYTTMVAYELSDDQKRQEEQQSRSQQGDGGKGGVASGKPAGMSSTRMAALGVGVVAVGAAVYFAGDIASTFSNAGPLADIGTGLGDAFGGLADSLGGCCDGCDGVAELLSCGGCDGCDGLVESLSCGGCGDCGDCADIFSCFGDIGDCCGDIADGCGDMIEGIGECVGDCDLGGCADGLGECAQGAGECVGEVLGALGNL